MFLSQIYIQSRENEKNPLITEKSAGKDCLCWWVKCLSVHAKAYVFLSVCVCVCYGCEI